MNIYIAFITKSYFKVLKNIRQSSIYYFITEIPRIWDLQLIAINYSSDIEFKDFVKIYKKVYFKTIFFFSKWYMHQIMIANDNASDCYLWFRRNLLKSYYVNW